MFDSAGVWNIQGFDHVICCSCWIWFLVCFLMCFMIWGDNLIILEVLPREIIKTGKIAFFLCWHLPCAKEVNEKFPQIFLLFDYLDSFTQSCWDTFVECPFTRTCLIIFSSLEGSRPGKQNNQAVVFILSSKIQTCVVSAFRHLFILAWTLWVNLRLRLLMFEPSSHQDRHLMSLGSGSYA